MNTTIMLFLIQDGITNGAVYALLGLALVLVAQLTEPLPERSPFFLPLGESLQVPQQRHGLVVVLRPFCRNQLGYLRPGLLLPLGELVESRRSCPAMT